MHSVRRVRAIGIVAVVFTLGMLAAHPAVAQSDHEIVYVEDFAHGKVDPSPYAPGTMENPWIGLADNTGGIEPAVNSCKAKHTGSQDGASLQGCIVVLPRGFVEITETIDVNWDDVWLEGLAQYGIVVRGHGYGLKENGLSRSFAGTILVWQGEANATVLRIRDTSFSSFEDFLIDGDGDADGYHKAGIGIEVTSGGSAKNITIRRVGIESVTGDPGVGIDAGSSFQMSEMEFDTLWIRGVNVGVHQWGKQTADVTYRKIEVAQFEKYGMDFEAAPIDVHDCVFMNTSGSATADIHVKAQDLGTGGAGPMALWALFEGNYHETNSGSAYLFHSAVEDAQYKRWPTTILNTRVNWFRDGGNIIDYRHPAPLNLIGCSFDLSDSTRAGTIYIGSPAGQKLTATLIGNFYENRSGFHKVRLATGGDVTVVSDDAGLVDAAGDSLDAAGLFLTGGSLNWTTVDSGGIAAIPFRLDLDTTSSPSKFVLRNSAGLAISSWSEDGSLSLGTSSPSVSLGSTTVVPENPSAAATITLPATSGTVLLNSTVLPMIEQLCGTVEIDPGLINAKTSSETEAPYSGLSGAEVCSCVPLAEWGDDIIVNYCYAGSNALTVRLYNADTKSVNPPSRTMRFCCSKP